MRVPIYLLLLTSVAWAQQGGQGPTQPDPTQPSGPGNQNTLPDTNPWHELLHRMMELMQTAAGVGTGPSQGQGPDTTSNQNQGQQGQFQDQGQQQGHSQQQQQQNQQTRDAQAQTQSQQQGQGQYQDQGQPQGQYQDQGQQQGQYPDQGQQQGQDPYQDQGQQGQIQNQRQGQQQGQGRLDQGRWNQGQGQWGQNNGRRQMPNATPPPPPPKPTTPPRPLIQDCFWEGKYYRPGTDIVRGQHDRWCYVTYCDSQGNIQFWDDYNCPPNSMKPTSGHTAGRPGGGGPPTTAPPNGCLHEGVFYEPGVEITNHRVGDRCYGTYCSYESQVLQWDDWCLPTTTPSINQGPPSGGQPPSQPSSGPGNQQSGPQGGQGKGPAAGASRGPQGGGGNKPNPQKAAGPKQQGPGGNQQGQGRRRGKPQQGCYHNNLYYMPNEDVIVGNIGDMCYGYYCEGDNVFVHWEDRCAHQPTAPAPTTAPNTGFNMGGPSGFFFK